MTARHHFASYLLALRTKQAAFWLHPNEEYAPVMAKRILVRLVSAWSGFVQALDIANHNAIARPLRDLDRLVTRIPARLDEVPYATRTKAIYLLETWQESLDSFVRSLPAASGVQAWFQLAERMLGLRANPHSKSSPPEDWVVPDNTTHKLNVKCGESFDTFFPAADWSEDEQRGKEWQQLHPDYWIWDVLEAGVKRLGSTVAQPESLEGAKSTSVRNAKIYELAQDPDNAWKLIRKAIKSEFGEELTEQGLQKAARAYASAKKLPLLPDRKPGRRKG